MSSKLGKKDQNSSSIENLEEDLLYANDVVFRKFFSNHIHEAIDSCTNYREDSVYMCFSKTAMLAFPALMSLDEGEISETFAASKKAAQLCISKRKSYTWTENMVNMVKKTDYDKWTEDEIHAEIIYGVTELIRSVVTFFSNPSVTVMIKGAFRIKAANQSLELCLNILERRTLWPNKYLKDQFEAITLASNGIIGLILSHLPDKILMLISMFGFHGDRTVAVDRLMRAMKIGGLGSTIAYYFFAFYTVYREYIFMVEGADMNLAKQIIDQQLAIIPDSILWKLLLARYNNHHGYPDEAILCYNEILEVQNMKGVAILCYHDLVWTHAVKLDWNNAIKYSKLCEGSSDLCKAFYKYQEAAFTHILMETNKSSDIFNEVSKLMKSVPELRKRKGGKTIPMDKFAVEKANQFQNEGKLTLPALELMYVFNILHNCSDNRELIKPFMNILNHKEKEAGREQLKEYEDSIKCLKQVIAMEKKIRSENKKSCIIPHSILELGTTYYKDHNYDNARFWLKSCKDYSGFLVEAIVQMRVSGTLQLIKAAEKR